MQFPGVAYASISLASNGHEVPTDGFPDTHAVIADAQARRNRKQHTEHHGEETHREWRELDTALTSTASSCLMVGGGALALLLLYAAKRVSARPRTHTGRRARAPDGRATRGRGVAETRRWGVEV